MIWIFQFGIQHQEYASNDSRVFFSPYINDQLTCCTTLPDCQNAVHSLTDNTVYLSPHMNYSNPVTAIHSYDGNKADPNELSFSKGEVMYVYEKQGSWWQAKKTSGEIGVIPSNYVQS
ncbi:hypothetical protein BY458DRAFT_537880 [Sporodiniella umbellata]|nr:hypothetical protein BY458DRAFT_537880 [Sporodiniella umbellata]